MKLVYTIDAVEDLRRLRDFLAQKNPTAAAKAAQNLLTQLDKLTEFPHMGKPVTQAPQPSSLRDLIFGPYHIRYSLHQETLIILKIWQSREQHTN